MDAVVQTNRTTRASVSQHLEDRFDDTQGTGRNDLSVQRRLWMNMTGNFGHVDKDVHGQRYEFDTRGVVVGLDGAVTDNRSEEHTSELQSLMRISYAVFCLKKKYS